jgi:hypothetical protein
LAVSLVVRSVFGFSVLFKLHVSKFFGVKDFATLQALDKLGVFVPGNDSNPGVFAGGSHRFVEILKNLPPSEL